MYCQKGCSEKLCKFYRKIFKNTFFEEHLRTTVSLDAALVSSLLNLRWSFPSGYRSYLFSEVAVDRFSIKKLFRNNSKGHSIYPTIQCKNVFKIRPWYWCFPVNFAKYFSTVFLYNISWRLFFALKISLLNLNKPSRTFELFHIFFQSLKPVSCHWSHSVSLEITTIALLFNVLRDYWKRPWLEMGQRKTSLFIHCTYEKIPEIVRSFA